MGRLTRLRFARGSIFRLVVILVSLVISGVFFYKNAQIGEPSESQLKLYLENNTIFPETGTDGEYQRIYFIFDGQKIPVTDGTVNAMNPMVSGQFIVWTEQPYQSQDYNVVLYDVVKKAHVQLTFGGTNLKPFVDNGRVVWEDWNSTTPYIKYYDGSNIISIGRDKLSVRPAIKGNQIIYAQELSPDNWQTIVYTIDDGQTSIVASGSQSDAGWPRFEFGRITTNNPVY